MTTTAMGLGHVALVTLALAVAALSQRKPERVAWIAAGFVAGEGTLLVLSGYGAEPSSIDVAWIPSLGSRLHLALDPLATLMCGFATAVAAPVLVFTARYLSLHLREEQRSLSEMNAFCGLMVAFVGAMVLLFCAHDLLLMFVALELTAVLSFLLIGFDHTASAQRSARAALVVTVGTSLSFLLGVLWIGRAVGHLDVPRLLSEPAAVPPLAVGLLVFGVLAKSAQMPFHYWLPRAMVAPTPVSAYLHSAALVSAGAFVLVRLQPLYEGVEWINNALAIIGFCSIFVGGALAATADGIKRVLAYSTVAQYGYAFVLLSSSGDAARLGAPFFIVSHGVCKCGLFLTAGFLKSTLHVEKLSRAGGLMRRLPFLAAASGVLALGLAGAPLSIGYFKDELFFAANLERGNVAAFLAVGGTALTLAYVARFWWRIFGGPRSRRNFPEPERHTSMLAPIGLLALATLVGGIASKPLEAMFSGVVVQGGTVGRLLAYHFDGRAENWMALGVLALGLALFFTREGWRPRLSAVLRSWGGRLGPDMISERLLRGVRRFSDEVHRWERRDVRQRLMIVLGMVALLVGSALLDGGLGGHARFVVTSEDLPVAAALVVSAVAALAAVRPIGHLGVILLLSFVGFSLSAAFVLAGAPDLALVLVLIEMAMSVLFVGVLWQLRPEVLAGAKQRDDRRTPRLAGLIGGSMAAVLSWNATSSERAHDVASEHIALTSRAHAKDVVTAILADFRGLDTAVEVTVFGVAILSAATLHWGKRDA